MISNQEIRVFIPETKLYFSTRVNMTEMELGMTEIIFVYASFVNLCFRILNPPPVMTTTLSDEIRRFIVSEVILYLICVYVLPFFG